MYKSCTAQKFAFVQAPVLEMQLQGRRGGRQWHAMTTIQTQLRTIITEPACVQTPVHKVHLHVGAAAVDGMLAGRVEVELQQLPPLPAGCHDVAFRRQIHLQACY